MNIFFTHHDPKIAASMLPYCLLVKMQVESIQMLVSACLNNGMDSDSMPFVKEKTHKHKGGYKNHVCTKWVGESILHWDWLAKHTEYLGYYHQLHRLYKNKNIKQSYAQTQLTELLSIRNKINNFIPNNGFSLPPCAFEKNIKSQYPEILDLPTIEGYRFYVSKKWYFLPEQYISWQSTNLTKIVN